MRSIAAEAHRSEITTSFAGVYHTTKVSHATATLTPGEIGDARPQIVKKSIPLLPNDMWRMQLPLRGRTLLHTLARLIKRAATNKPPVLIVAATATAAKNIERTIESAGVAVCSAWEVMRERGSSSSSRTIGTHNHAPFGSWDHHASKAGSAMPGENHVFTTLTQQLNKVQQAVENKIGKTVASQLGATPGTPVTVEQGSSLGAVSTPVTVEQAVRISVFSPRVKTP